MPGACMQAKLRLTKRQKEQLAAQGKESAAIALMLAQSCAAIACALQVCHHLPFLAELWLLSCAVGQPQSNELFNLCVRTAHT